jgi:flagellar biosynthesis repressor protein FlbT
MHGRPRPIPCAGQTPLYLGFIKELRDAVPGARETIDTINHHVSGGALYKALKEIRKLMKREDELQAA